MDQVQEIREKIDIVSFMSEYLPLKKAGRNFKTNCPFHNENTPSFVVSPERQIWHCFGCSKGGDAFTFLMEYENLEFPEALRILAKKTGIVLRESSFKTSEYSEKEKIFSINNYALKFYNFILTEHKAGNNALDYLINKRKITRSAINTFEIGFSPLSGNALCEFLIKKKNFTIKDLLIAGVATEIRGEAYDFFKGRIMFPLFDHRGNVTGFSGRGLSDNDIPKYINTKETAVYHKGNMFFGLNVAKEEIKKKQDAIIVEGEFDAISLFEENIKNVVAIKGTALTEGQVALLSRFTQRVTLCLDQDSAGFEATKRSLEVLEKKGLSVDTIVLKNAKDPDEAIKEDVLGFKKSIKDKIGIYDYLIEKYLSQNDSNSAVGKKEITDNLLPLFSNITNEIIKEHYLKKLSKILDTSYESLLKETEKNKAKILEEKVVILPKNKRSEREIIEEFVLALILQSNKSKQIITANKEFLQKYIFEKSALGKLCKSLIEYFELSDKFDSGKFSKALSGELMHAYDVCLLYPLSKFGLDESNELKYNQEITKKIDRLKEFNLKDKIKGKKELKNI
jgi:DNA primase